jgi:antitoxin (DNA-binding transcriptional repressor) of toxin-antitoxin stability system
MDDRHADGEDANGQITDAEIARWLADPKAFAADIGQRWPPGVSSVEAVNDVRRDLGKESVRHPMSQVGIKEFKTHASEIFRRVRDDGEIVDVTYRGEVIARISPVQSERRPSREEIKRHFAEFDRFAAEIAQRTPPDLTAADVINDIRRDL